MDVGGTTSDVGMLVHGFPREASVAVDIGGVATMGEESLMGGEVNLVFRLEKLAGSLGEPCCLSERARTKLDGLVIPRSLGEFDLKGFEEKCAFYAL